MAVFPGSIYSFDGQIVRVVGGITDTRGAQIRFVHLSSGAFGDASASRFESGARLASQFEIEGVGEGAMQFPAETEEELVQTVAGGGVTNAAIGEGEDTRNWGGEASITDIDDLGNNGTAGVPIGAAVVVAASRLLPLVPLATRPALITWLRGALGTTLAWGSLPGWVRGVLTVAGWSGAAIAVDALIDLPGGLDIIGNGDSGHVMHGAEVVGSWVSNNVTFYRLKDGKLAVQKKNGTWKVWRPKKPIVLYADGAKDLKTMLRADKALNKQAKALAAMLNRRSPRPRKTPSAPHPMMIQPGQVVIPLNKS